MSILYCDEQIETVEDVWDNIGGILYFVNKNGKEVDDFIPNDTKVLAINHIGGSEDQGTYFDEYKITIDI